MTVVLGVDLGGTTIDAIAVDSEDNISASTTVATRTGSGDEVVASVLEAVDNLTKKLGESPTALTLGLPGIVDPQAGTVHHALNLGIEESFPIAARLVDALGGLSVSVENDVRLGAIGAHRRFAQPNDSLVYLGIGTGIAAGIVLDGTLYRGSTGMAGEIGHSSFAPSAVRCHCGRTGCLEAVASGPAIEQIWPRHHAAEDLFEKAAAGETRAIAVVDPVITHLAHAIDVLVRMFDPGHVVLGGGVGTSTPALRTLLTNKFAEMAHNVLLSESDLDARLRQLPAGWPAGARGAAWIAKQINHTQEG